MFAVLSLLFVAAACGGDDGATDDAGKDQAPDAGGQSDAEIDPDGVVRIGYDLVSPAKGALSFDPKEALTNVGDYGVLLWVYGGLMRRSPDGKLVPDLAERARVVDPTTVEVVLRPDLEYSDGTPMTADDVAASIESNLSDPNLPAFNADFYSLESVEVTEPHTLVFDIPDGTAPSWFDDFIAAVETIPVKLDTDFRSPVGAGPMRVVDFRPETRVVFEKNSRYWNADEIKVAGAELIHAAGGTTAGVSALRAEQVDFVTIDPAQVDSITGSLDTVRRATMQRVVTLPMCKTVAPLDDARVRRALSISIDRQAINDALFNGTAIPAATQWPPDDRLYLDGMEDEVEFDPEEARELLAEAGYEDGVTIDLMTIQAVGMPEAAQIIQQQWSDVGVTTNLVNGTNFVQDFWIDKKAPMAIIPLMSDPLAQWVGDALFNHCPLNDPVLDGLAAELQTVSRDSDEALDIVHDIQRHMMEESLGIFLLFQPSISAYDTERLGEVAEGPFFIPLPDLWSVYVKA